MLANAVKLLWAATVSHLKANIFVTWIAPDSQTLITCHSGCRALDWCLYWRCVFLDICSTLIWRVLPLRVACHLVHVVISFVCPAKSKKVQQNKRMRRYTREKLLLTLQLESIDNQRKTVHGKDPLTTRNLYFLLEKKILLLDQPNFLHCSKVNVIFSQGWLFHSISILKPSSLINNSCTLLVKRILKSQESITKDAHYNYCFN